MARFPTTASKIRDFSNSFYVRLFQQRVNGMNARARDLGIDGRVTFEELLAVFETCGWKCVGCGSERDLHADHVIPMKEGGRNAADNLRVLCESCNCARGGH